MKPPTKVKVGGYTYKVSTDEAFLNNVALDNGDGRLAGATRHRTQTIVLDTDAHKQQVQDTLLHEVLHVVNEQVRVLGEPRSPAEEEAILRLTPALLTVLRENPKLIEFLVEP